ncbi:hypothetical protein FRB91_011116 [Serendipita sp. 411]|nr:hypothetical protein FRC18_003291 [Serendipita sp. 400]KAG8848171.1 hypothetical protein FRB91_011116 [Serendipita sp. 411]
MNTVYEPVFTPSPQYNGTIQASVSGSAGSNTLSKSVIIGIVCGAFVLRSLITVCLFYLGRRRKAPRHLETLQLHDSTSYNPEGSPEDEQRIDQFLFLGTATLDRVLVVSRHPSLALIASWRVQGVIPGRTTRLHTNIRLLGQRKLDFTARASTHGISRRQDRYDESGTR